MCRETPHKATSAHSAWSTVGAFSLMEAAKSAKSLKARATATRGRSLTHSSVPTARRHAPTAKDYESNRNSIERCPAAPKTGGSRPCNRLPLQRQSMTSSRHASFLPEQKLVAVFDHHELHFPLHRRLAVFGAHDPTVEVGHVNVVGARVDDRLDCKAHARHENRALPASVAWRSARLFWDAGFVPFLP